MCQILFFELVSKKERRQQSDVKDVFLFYEDARWKDGGSKVGQKWALTVTMVMMTNVEISSDTAEEEYINIYIYEK